MPQIISREEAKALGLKRYFTGKPCKHGHLAQRKVSNTECVVCAAAVCRNYYANNKEYHFRKTARYREENRERYNEYNRSYHAALTPEQKKRRQLFSTQASPEKRRENYEKNKHKYFARAAARRALLRGQKLLLTQAEVDRVNCIYEECRRLNEEAGRSAYHVDHIHPLSKGGSHHPDNLRIITAEENLAKGANLPEDSAA